MRYEIFFCPVQSGDLLHALRLIFPLLGIYPSIVVTPLVLNAIIPLAARLFLGTIVYLPSAFLIGIWIIISDILEPRDVNHACISPQEQAVALDKAIYLRRHFGIVSEVGQLLTYSKEGEATETSELQGHFGQLLRNQGLKILEEIQCLQEKLPKRARLQPESTINKSAIFTHLRTQTLSEHNSKFVEGWIQNFEQLCFGAEKLATCINRYLPTGPGNRAPKIKPISYSEKDIRASFNIAAPANSVDWGEFVNTHVQKLDPQELCHEIVYKQFKNHILQKVDQRTLLGIEPLSELTEEIVQNRYKTLARSIHPDKVVQKNQGLSTALREEANRLFLILTEATEQLIESTRS
jgi:hypothetical protein